MSYRDDRERMQGLEGKYSGGRALIVLGGPSAINWRQFYRNGYDVLIGVNGTVGQIQELDYWLLTENLTHMYELAQSGSQRFQKMIEILTRPTKAQRLVNWKSIQAFSDQEDIIKIQRYSFVNLFDFNPHVYGDGLLTGPLFSRFPLKPQLRVGTVGLQSLHLASLLGCKRIDTIGFDLCFKDGVPDHWYEYPPYEGVANWGPEMLTEYAGLKTLWWWVEAAQYLKAIDRILLDHGIVWLDYSDGLLEK